MSKVQQAPREELRQGIRELWTATKSGTRLDKQRAIKKIKYAVEREERIMLNKIQVEETDELDDLDGLAEGLEIAEALAEGKPVAGEQPVKEVVEAPTAEEPSKRRGGRRKAEPLGVTEEKPRRQSSRRKKTPNDDGSGHHLALGGNGHGAGGGQVTLSPAQLSKLWGVITGGSLDIQANGNGVVCRVSAASFEKALPALIDRL